MKTGIRKFCEKHSGSKIILKVVYDLFFLWKGNQSITFFRCYFHINKGHDHLLLVDDSKNDEDQGKVTGDI